MALQSKDFEDNLDDLVESEDMSDLIQEEKKPGKMESITRGGLQGLSMGYSDEVIAVISALINIAKDENKTLDDVVNEYSNEVAQVRGAERAAKEASPASYSASEFVASILGPGSKLKVGGRIGTMMAQAGIEGFGRAEGDVVGQTEQGISSAALAPAMAVVVEGGAKVGGKLLGKGWQMLSDSPIGELSSDLTGNLKDKLKFIYQESMARGKKLHAPESIKDAQQRVFELPRRIKQSVDDAIEIVKGEKQQLLKELDKQGKIDANEITGMTDDIWQAITPNKTMIGEKVRDDFKEAYAKKGEGTLADIIDALDKLKVTHPDKASELSAARNEIESIYHNTLFGSKEGYSKFLNSANKNQVAYMDKANKMMKKVADGKMMKSEFNMWEKQALAELETKQGLLLDKSIKKLKPSEIDNMKREIQQAQSFKLVKQFGADYPRMKGKDYGFSDINKLMTRVEDHFDNKLLELNPQLGERNKEISTMITAKDMLDKTSKNLIDSNVGEYNVARSLQNVSDYKKMLEQSGLGDLSSHIDESVNEILPLHEAMKIVGKNSYMEGGVKPAFGVSAMGKTAGMIGQESAPGGVINRSLNAIKDKRDAIYANLAPYSPETARGFLAAAESGDDKKLGMTVSSIISGVPGAKDFVQPSPLKTSDGREILSLFDDKVYDPNEVQVLREDIMKRSDLSNSDKASMIDSLNKDGKIMSLPKKDVEMDTIDVPSIKRY